MKYCTLYLVRHGETDWNVKGLIQGHSDIPLNENGVKQVKNLAIKLRTVKFNAVYSSDLIRAKRTAEIIAMEKKLAVKTTAALRERYFGKYEGINWREDKEYQKLFDKYLSLSKEERFKKSPHPTIETDEKLMGRFITFLREIAVFYPGGNILVVTHGGVMRAFLLHLGFGDPKTLPPGSIENTAYVKILSDGVDFFVKETFGIIKKQ